MALRKLVTGIPASLIGLLVLGHVAFAGERLALTLLAIELKASAQAIGLAVGLMMVLPMLLAVQAGRWSDRFGYMRPAAVGLGLLLLGGILLAGGQTMMRLYMASVLIGSGYMLAHVAVNSAIGHASSTENRTRAFSMLALGFSLSGMTGPLIAGFVIDHLGHAAAFVVLSGFPAVSLGMLALLRRTGRHWHAPMPAPATRARVMDLLRHAPLRAVFVVSGLLSMGWDLFTFLAPLHGARSGLSATATGTLLGAFGAGTFAVRLILPALARRASEWRTLSGALLVTALVYLIFPLFHTLALLLAAAFALGLSLGCGQPVAMSLLHASAPASRAGEAIGVRSTITSASQTFLPLLFGALGSALGVVAVFWAAATVLVAGGALAGRRK